MKGVKYMNYTAETLVNKLREDEGISISVRTLNYYAYDRKMFPNLGKGKCAFSDEEYKLLKRITYLKDKTSMSLDEIKDCISNDVEYNKKVNNLIADTVMRSQTGEIASTETYSNFVAPMSIDLSDKSKDDVAFLNSCCSFGSTETNAITSGQTRQPYITSDNFVPTTSTGIATSNLSTYPQQSYDSYDTNHTASGHISMNYQETQPEAPKSETTVRINKDVTITVSSDISRERLIEIINFINSK